MQLDEISNYFPTGIAEGDAFVNRILERKQLEKSMISRQHTLLMAPRRYGKTSLITQVASEIDYPFCVIDLFTVYNQESVNDILIDKIGRLATDLLPPVQQAKKKLLTIFKNMNPEITLSSAGQKLTLQMPKTPNNIADLFLKLDEAAVLFEKKAIVFMDEMQQIGFLENGNSIEAMIRHAVERSKNISYCFSGSSRHLLKNMFGDSGRPLYRLCQMMEIERIHHSHYKPHLQKLSQARWGEIISDSVINKIIEITEDHPFYINVLCQNLWLEGSIPNLEKVDEVWNYYIKSNRSLIVDDIISLTLNQKKVLSALAQKPIKEIYSQESMMIFKLTQSSVKRVIDSLLEKDLIFINKLEEYQILDPAIRYFLLNV
jgi:AAA+ ATPase superfamily predicted ATPase